MTSVARRAVNRLQSAGIYRGVLGRYPSVREALRLEAKTIARSRSTEGHLWEMLQSDEFWRMQISDLLWRDGTTWNGRCVAFAHIPKTAGTSVTWALAETIGVPPMTFYDRNRTRPRAMRDVAYWPLFSGHDFSVLDAPSTHFAMTVLREPRSRLLSLFRQHESGQFRSAYDGHLKRRPPRTRESDGSWAAWLVRSLDRPSFARTLREPGVPPSASNYRALMDTTGWESRLSPGAARVDGVAWAHRSEELQAMLNTAAGGAVTLGRRNVRVGDGEVAPPRVRISAADLRQLEAMAAIDMRVASVLHDQAGLPPLEPEEADRVFEETVERLNFEVDR